MKSAALIISLFAVLLLAHTPGKGGTGDKSRPNVLYIFTDDQSVRTVSCYAGAYPWVNTPNIDKLAERGVRFTCAYTGAKCVPSRGNALTGLLQHNYSKETAYWPAQLRKNGYYTGMTGKWHWNVPRHTETWDWSAVWEHYLPENAHNYYWDQSLRINADSLLVLKQYSTDAYTDLTVRFIRERAKNNNQPWYFWLCYGAVHGPYTPADRHKGYYAGVPEMDYPEDVFGPRPDKPENVVNLEMNKKDPVTGKPVRNGRTLDSWVKQYNEAVRAIDEGVGRIMDVLEETGQLENTLVIFTSDQGFAWGQHGYNLKIAPYDASLLAPLIFVQPGVVPENKVSDVPVNGVDIVSSIFSFCGICPELPLDGRDLKNLVLDPEHYEPENKNMIQIYTGNNYGNKSIVNELEKAHKSGNWSKFEVHAPTGTKAWMMLRTGQYKYNRYIYPGYIEELYDLKKDPEELVNLAVKNEYRGLLHQLRAQLLTEFEKKGAGFLYLLPPPVEKTIY